MMEEHIKREIILKGFPAAPGIAMGYAYVYIKEIPRIEVRLLYENDIEIEIARLHRAIEKSSKELNKILDFARQKVGDAKAKIFEAQIMVLEDQLLIETIIKRIKIEKKNSEYIVNDEIGKYANIMRSAHDEYMHDRANDVEDLRNRIVRNLQQERLISKLEGAMIIVAHSLTTADTVILSRNQVLGYATDSGGPGSHAAILARSLKIPAVPGLGNVSRRVVGGDFLIMDGYSGDVIINPTDEHIKEYEQKRERLLAFENRLADLKDLPAETIDGHKVELSANIELPDEIEYVVVQGAQGVGLYRTESLLIGRDDFPSEEEQYAEYKKVAERVYPNRVIIRTFDIGGDKLAPEMAEEANPFLGWRGIRVSLDRPDLFMNQLRAILRASARKNLAIMFPMVSSLSEVHRAKEYVHQAKAELRAKEIKFDDKIQIGVMIEVPAAALAAKEIAAEVNFLSLGTNDLIQYMLAVERGNSLVSELYQEFNPSVVQIIKRVIDAGHKHGIWVGVCGEMASDPIATPLLLGFGLDEFSVVPFILPEIKKIIRSLNYKDAKQLAKKVLSLSTTAQIKECLNAFMHKECPDIPIDSSTSS
jgi:phosphoenolpyruvate-protein phosphotransferase (PTS system enzyme I)